MPFLMQLCVVVVTITLVALCVATLRAVGRIEKTAERVSEAADAMTAALGNAREIAHEAHEVLESVNEAAARLRGTAIRFERLGDRALQLSNAVMDEVAAPVNRVTAVMRGVRSGLGLIVSRLAGGSNPAPKSQGGSHEGGNHERGIG